MRRLFTTSTLLLCSLLTFAQFSGTGAGTENDPYKITNPLNFNQLRNYVNQSGVYFKIINDIDLTEFIEEESPSQGWQPVGNQSAPFKGIIDGNGKKIKGLWTKRGNQDYVGLFGYMSGSKVKDLTIVDATIVGKGNVGSLAGYCDNCTFSGISLSAKVQGSEENVGGVIGYVGNYVALSDLTNTVEVSSTSNNVGGIIGKNEAYNSFSILKCRITDSEISGKSSVGGICGSSMGRHANSNNMDSCYIYANVTGEENVGGICGYSNANVHYANMSNCGFSGNVKGTKYVGGLSGNNSGNLNNCFALGSVSSTGDYAGGLIGYAAHTITNSYFSGSVSGKDYTGGLVGYKSDGATQYCYSTASVAGGKYVGGLIGKNSGTVKSCAAINTRVTATEGEVGRVVGQNIGAVGTMGTLEENKAYNKTIIISQGVALEVNDDQTNGTGVGPSTLRVKATYVAMGWDFTKYWSIQETECYPYLKSQMAPPVITSRAVSGATTISGKCADGGTVILELDGIIQKVVSSNHTFSFTVDPLQAGHFIRISTLADGKEPSYYATEMISFLGKGTEDNPYQIYTAADLTQVFRKGYYKLMNDIDLTSYINKYYNMEGWESVGREGSETIYFDGNGHKVTGLWCNTTRNNTGLFSCFANGYIKNLTVETASGKQVKGGNYTGIIIGKLINGEMTGCKAFGNVADGTPVGGLIGKLEGGKIYQCQADVVINSTGEDSYIGGLVGELTGEVAECLSNGSLKATGAKSYVGGLVGLNNVGSNIINSYSNTKTVASLCAAGLVAYNYGVVEKCYATGDIYTKNYGAGVVGYNDGAGAIIKHCAATSSKIEVDYESQQSAQGGGYGMRIIGGCKNGAPEPEMNNYASKSMQLSINDVVQKIYDDIFHGVGKNGSELAQASTYKELGWDFANIWKINENESLPLLRNNTAEAVDRPEDEPEPIATTDDRLTVSETAIVVGKTTTIGINLENATTDLTAYQFDLTLPNGFTLVEKSTGGYEVTKSARYSDDNQALNITPLQDGANTYRIVSFSMANGTITGTTGAILNAVVSAGTDLEDGDYEAFVKNIILTKADGKQLKLSDIKFLFVIKSIIMGDANGDGEVNVTDIVEIVNKIMNKPSAKFVKAAADVNLDGEINVTDIVHVVNIIMGNNTNATRTNRRANVAEQDNNDVLTLTEKADGLLSLELDNDYRYLASQFDIRLSEGMQLNNINLNTLRGSRHQLVYSEIAPNLYRVMAYAMDNESFAGNQGELLNIQVSGNGHIVVDNILFVAENWTEKSFSALGNNTTGISNIATDQQMDIYSINGQRINEQVTGTAGLSKGVYIINGKKYVVK